MPGQQAITFELDGPVTLCVNQFTGLVTKAPGAACPGNHVPFVLPEQSPLEACANNFTNALRHNPTGACQAIETPYVIE